MAASPRALSQIASKLEDHFNSIYRGGSATSVGPWPAPPRHAPRAPTPRPRTPGYVGYSRPLGAIIIVFRGTDSHSLYNWCAAG